MMWTWNSFLTPLIFTLNTPGLRTLSVGMLAFVGEYYSDNTGLAAFLALQKYFVEGVAGAVKDSPEAGAVTAAAVRAGFWPARFWRIRTETCPYFS